MIGFLFKWLSFLLFVAFLNLMALLLAINQRRVKAKFGIEPILLYMLIYIINFTTTKIAFKFSTWMVFFETVLLLVTTFFARKIKVIGITGGIACGKSTICSFMGENLKIPVVSADQISRDIMKPGMPAYNEVLKTFGRHFLDEKGEIDRPKLGKEIFSDKAQKSKLNKITHRRILMKTLGDIFNHLFRNNSQIVLLEAPLLFETFWLQFICYPIIVVYIGDKDRWIKMLCQRDNIDMELAKKKILAQMSIDEKIKKADFAIDNDSTEADLHKKLLEQLPEYL